MVEVHAESFDAGGGEVVHAIWEAVVCACHLGGSYGFVTRLNINIVCVDPRGNRFVQD